MANFLLLTLYAPLVSWGDITVGETRSSWDRPSRSALLGILAAALGIERTDQPAHDALDQEYAFAVRLDAAGAPFADYHTAQTVSESALKKHLASTRRELLEAGERETILSRRSYRTDALATVVVWASNRAKWPLAEMRAALLRPVFVLYAGRKANPFGLPLDPELVDATDLAAAFALRQPQKTAELIGARPDYAGSRGWGREVAYDVSLPAEIRPAGAIVLRRETRRDAAPDRSRWSFAERTVEIALLPGGQEQRP